MTRQCAVAVILACLACDVSAHAQAISRPPRPPERTAAGESWYASRDPIFVAGAYYHPAGASVFFDPDTMVPIARIDWVPIYADTTLEPNSVVFVPVGRGLMQPYERRRAGDLAGTTGSRAPSFPVSLREEGRPERVAAFGETSRIPHAIGGYFPPQASGCPCPEPARMSAPAGPVWTTLRPVDSRGIWIPFEGRLWVSDGDAERYDAARFVPAGTYAGYPVYRADGNADRLYVPGVEGFLTPYRRTPTPVP